MKGTKKSDSDLQTVLPGRAGDPMMSRLGRTVLDWLTVTAISLAIAVALSGCVYPEGYSDWQWRQANPNYRPLPWEENY